MRTAIAARPHAMVASVLAFTFSAGKITEIYILADRSRLARLGLVPADDGSAL
jgi:hypothetical protein